MTTSIERGNQAEKFVGTYLETLGFDVLEYNYKKRFGEIDIIAQKDKLLIFVEVKMRTNIHFDSAQLITVSKQKRIINVAHEYISRYNHDEKICRLDVALVGIRDEKPEITYIPNAFGEE